MNSSYKYGYEYGYQYEYKYSYSHLEKVMCCTGASARAMITAPATICEDQCVG